VTIEKKKKLKYKSKKKGWRIFKRREVESKGTVNRK